ncbi:MAG: hypothetical protein AAF555_07390 [Verrucomicrobiota bacterium]
MPSLPTLLRMGALGAILWSFGVCLLIFYGDYLFHQMPDSPLRRFESVGSLLDLFNGVLPGALGALLVAHRLRVGRGGDGDSLLFLLAAWGIALWVAFKASGQMAELDLVASVWWLF